MNSRPVRLWSCLTRSGAALAATVMLASGCASVATPTPQIAVHAPTALMANASSACRTGWAAAPETRDAALDPDRIALVNWNIKKGSRSDWRDQLEMLTAGADLVTLQEAPLASTGWRDLESDLYHAFAPGWMSRNTPTGVMTLSDAAHLVQCNMQAREPWLRSPKATLATEYALIDRAETLLVVNVHVVNFSLGLAAFDRQLEQVRARGQHFELISPVTAAALLDVPVHERDATGVERGIAGFRGGRPTRAAGARGVDHKGRRRVHGDLWRRRRDSGTAAREHHRCRECGGATRQARPKSVEARIHALASITVSPKRLRSETRMDKLS
ncbi:MAG: hypothetical protein AAFV30_04760 [Pseudomonadota bacterium]